MSTFDPGLEPPGDWQQPSYEPPPFTRMEAANRAAVYLWVSAGAQLLMSCCCGFSAIMLMVMGVDELANQLPPDLPNREAVDQVLPIMGPILLVVSIVLLLIPGIVLALLAFKVKSARRGATLTATIILGIQTLGLGVMVLMNLAGVFITRSVSDLFAIVVLGAVVLLFAITLAELIKALKQASSDTPPTDQGWPG